MHTHKPQQIPNSRNSAYATYEIPPDIIGNRSPKTNTSTSYSDNSETWESFTTTRSLAPTVIQTQNRHAFHNRSVTTRQAPLHRPALRKATKEAIHQSAPRDLSQRYIDVIEGYSLTRTVDDGHVYGCENRRLLAEARRVNMPQKKFANLVNAHPELFRKEDASHNRKHLGERPGHDGTCPITRADFLAHELNLPPIDPKDDYTRDQLAALVAQHQNTIITSHVYRKDLREIDQQLLNTCGYISGCETLEEVDEDGRTPLIHAVLAKTANPEIIRALLDRGANPDHHENGEERTALHYACIEKKSAIANVLLQNGANPNPTDKYGNTPLWYAIISPTPNINLISSLLAAGANPDQPNRVGMTPRQLAHKLGYNDILTLMSN